jgi:hypothetical protein
MKKEFLIIILLIASVALKAQDIDSVLTKRYIQKINIIAPGIAGELLINYDHNVTFNYNVGVKIKNQFFEKDYFYYSRSVTYWDYFFISLEARDYINKNRDNRIQKNKRIDKFSGPYASIKLEIGKSFHTFESKEPYYIELGPTIGFQRAIGKIWYWDVNAGVGPALNNDYFAFTFFSSIKFGIAF